MRRAAILATLAVIAHAGGARAESAPLMKLAPRFTLIEVQYPQLVAASGGAWLFAPSESGPFPGAVGDVELGLSGVTLALGAGVLSSGGIVQQASSFGLQGVVHRSWPWGSPWLRPGGTFVGGEVFGHFFVLRCSAGLLWSVTDGARVPTVGCGLGIP